MTEVIVTSSVLILLLAVLRRVMRGRISPWVQYGLWLLVAARLLIPGTLFTSPVSVAGAAAELRSSVRQSFTETSPDPYAPDSPSAVNPGGQLLERPVPETGSVDLTESRFPEFDMQDLESRNWLDIIWKTGIAVTGGGMVLSNLVFYFRLRRRRKRLTLSAATWSGKLAVYEMDGLPSPCLFGVFGPAIYLNGAAMDAEHPEHILAHEYAHYRHGDHVWAILRCVCLAVHWYNPLVWWAAAMSRQDCELACDAAALRRLGENERIDYGQTLLRMVSRGRNPSTLLRTATTMTAGKRAMKERIALIIKQPRMRKATLAAVVLLAGLLAVCTFGGNAEASTEPENEPEEDVAAAVQPEETADPGQDAMQENARSIVEQIQNGAGVSEWLPLMNYMDWGVLRQAAVEAGLDEGDGSGAAVELMFAIDRYVERQGGSMTTAEYLYILSATAGLDGAVTEGYAYTIHRMYIMNPSLFAYVALEQLPEEQQNAVLDLFLSEWYYNLVSDSPNMPTREEAIAQLEADLEAGIIATPSEATLRSEGSTFQFKLANASGIYALTYTSSDTSVAEVDGNGVVTAVGPGEAAISLHYEGAGGPLDFECRVLCEWDGTPAPQPAASPAEPQDDNDGNGVRYDDEYEEFRIKHSDGFASLERLCQYWLDELTAAPDASVSYDPSDERSLYQAVSQYLNGYAQNYFSGDFVQNVDDYDVQIYFSVPVDPDGPFTVSYTVHLTAAQFLPDEQYNYSAALDSGELQTVITPVSTI